MFSKNFEKTVRETFEIDKRIYFLFLCLVTFLLLLIKKNYIENETAAFDVLESRGQMGIFNIINAFQYLTIPFIYLWKFTLIGFLIWMGSFAFGYKIIFKKCFQIVMIAETVFIIPEFLKIGYFFLIETDPNLFDIRAYYPFSLMSFANYELLDPKWHYPLKALNVFEVIYWIILIYGVDLAAKKRTDIAAMIIFFSYIIFFFIWIWFYVNVYK